MPISKDVWLNQIAEGKLKLVFRSFQEFATHNQLGNFRQRILVLAARYSVMEQDRMDGIEDLEDLRQEEAAITKAVIQLIGTLPDELPKASKRPKGIEEHRFKNQILYLLLAAKVTVVVWLFTLWESGPFTHEQFISVVGIIVPVFATYLTLVIKDAAQNRHIDAPLDTRIIKRSFQYTTYWLIGIYVVVLLSVINLRGQGVLKEFGQMTTLLSMVESGLGVYIGQIVFALFKKEE
jgi:Effector-associated domain 11